MKKIIVILLTITPLFVFSQNKSKKSIDWMNLSKAEEFADKYNKNMLLFFYRPDCEYCEKMKNESLADPSVINLINKNFFPVIINGKSKDPITYNDTTYINNKSNPEDEPSIHNIVRKLVDMKDGNYYWPTIVIINGKHQKIIQGNGAWSKEQTLINLKQIISVRKPIKN